MVYIATQTKVLFQKQRQIVPFNDMILFLKRRNMDPNGRRSLRQKNSSVGESNPTEEKENHYDTLEPAEKSIN